MAKYGQKRHFAYPSQTLFKPISSTKFVPFASLNMKDKELVTLRSKEMQNGGKSLYLDYSVDGIRHKEYLHMYIVPERTKIDRLQNVETMKTAQAMKAKKIVDLQNGVAGFRTKRKKDVLLLDYLEQQKDSYAKQGKTEYSNTIGKILAWLRLYGKNVALRQVDKDYILDFLGFTRKGVPDIKEKDKEKKRGRKMSTKKGLSDVTVHAYYQTLSTQFNNAVRDHLMERNPIHDLTAAERPKAPESERAYLTYDEVQRLVQTECGNSQVKQAFLFACFTGLRLGDIESLTWNEIKQAPDGGLEVGTRQNKTQRMVYVPISGNAMKFLPERGRKNEKVFRLVSRSVIGELLNTWTKRAKIDKHISFHCSRHTYATLLLTYGADLYTVSKLLGHSDIGVTQIYAKIVDQKKQEAVNLIPKL